MTPPSARYGWVVVGVSTTVNMLAWSVRSTFGLFYVALLAEFGWRRGDAALGYSLSWLLLLVFAPLAGRLVDRWSARGLVAGAGLVLGTALALTGQATSLWHYYLAFGVLGAAGIGGIQIPAATIVNRWFARSRGAAMGIVSAGASASAILFYPVNAWLIVTFGWRTGFVLFGLVIALVTVPLAALLYRNPDDHGARRPPPSPGHARAPGHRGREDQDQERRRLADRPERWYAPSAPPAPGAATGSKSSGEDWTLGRALRSPGFWAVFAMWGLGVVGYQIVTTHQVAHAVERGFNPIELGWIFGLGGAFTVAGNLLGGWLSDWWGREFVFGTGSAIGIAGIAALAAVRTEDDLLLLLLYAASGVGFGMRIALLAAIPADLFAGRHLGVILGAAQGGGGLGGFIGPFLGGWLFDVTGGYQIAFAAAAVAIAGSAAAAWIAAPRRSLAGSASSGDDRGRAAPEGSDHG